MSKETRVDELATYSETGEVRFVVRRFEDGQIAGAHIARHPSTADAAIIIAQIDAMEPDWPAISDADADAIINTFAACPAYAPPAPSLDDLRADKRVHIDAQAQAHMETPFEWDFGAIEARGDDGASLGAAGVQSLQMRNDVDKTNWLAAHAAASTAMMLGAPDSPCPMKTTANVWVQTTAVQAMTALMLGASGRMSLFQRQKANLAHHGALKKALADAADEAALAAIDETAGWP